MKGVATATPVQRQLWRHLCGTIMTAGEPIIFKCMSLAEIAVLWLYRNDALFLIPGNQFIVCEERQDNVK